MGWNLLKYHLKLTLGKNIPELHVVKIKSQHNLQRNNKIQINLGGVEVERNNSISSSGIVI